ncbi:MAG: aspartate kinase [Acidobacteria bacterium]|nr:MAG: aspartate kinase [Acidobacteriota bacterium]
MNPSPIVVRKYGGTSVGSVERIRKVAGDLVRDHRGGLKQVVVVSAMGKTTDQLIGMARQITDHPSPRELDMLLTTGEQVSIALLAMAVHHLGPGAVSLTGAQCGIITDDSFSSARIQAINTKTIRKELEDGNIVIVAGFQGVTPDSQITTLGRGGSDTTATALAAALGVPCQIYTDVDGVFTADPNIVPEARLLDLIGYEEMLEYAASGSKVLHPRCVEIANKFNVPLEVRSSFRDVPGTTIVKEDRLEKVAITGVTGDAKIGRLALTRVRDVPGVAAKISRALGDAGICIRLIIQGINHDNSNDVSLIVAQDDVNKAGQILKQVMSQVGAAEVKVDPDVAKVSIIGSGVSSTPGVAGRMFQALAQEGINIDLISTSEVRIACIIRKDQLQAAVRAVHREFDLANLERKELNGV